MTNILQIKDKVQGGILKAESSKAPPINLKKEEGHRLRISYLRLSFALDVAYSTATDQIRNYELEMFHDLKSLTSE